MGTTINIFTGSGATEPSQASTTAPESAAQDAGTSAARQPDGSGPSATADKPSQMADAGEAPAALIQEVEAALRKAAGSGPRPAVSAEVATDAGSAPS